MRGISTLVTVCVLWSIIGCTNKPSKTAVDTPHRNLQSAAATTSSEPGGSHGFDVLYVLDAIEDRDNLVGELTEGGSFMIVKSEGTDRVTAMGKDALPSLLAIMQCDRLSFDIFARSYSTANEILMAVGGPKMQLHWYGGSSDFKMPNGRLNIEPGGQDDVNAFRHEIAADFANKIKVIQSWNVK
jgi:hypothetical protein